MDFAPPAETDRAMAQAPLSILCIEPLFPGRLGATADWLVRKRGFRCRFYCNTSEAREHWLAAVGQGLDVRVFGVGGVAREPAVAWSRPLERSLCYAYGCWEVVDADRPRPVDVVVGRSAGLGSSLFVPASLPSAPVINLFDYYLDPHHNDLADDDGPGASPIYTHWRRSSGAIELLDLENAALAWTPTHWQRSLFPTEYRNDLWVNHDGVDCRRFDRARATSNRRHGPRTIAGRTIPDSVRIVTFIARSIDRLRGFDRFWNLTRALVKARSNVVCVVLGDPVVRRGLDVTFNNRDYRATLMEQAPVDDVDRVWFLGKTPPETVAETLAASDLHIALGRPYPVARSVLEAMASGCVVLASDVPPHREVFTNGRTGLLVDPRDADAALCTALAALDDPAAHRPIGEAAADEVRARYDQDVCLPRLAERLVELANSGGVR
jgi:glycosyltransferase involved in cell wall biosynthesis